ncbi:MAG: hypothetical protein NTW19_07975 [Planctomycetota bacterium]|nr:hypothetical protein [Planctomycetota bacterium]
MFYIIVIEKARLRHLYERDSFEGAIERAIELAVTRGDIGKEGRIAAVLAVEHCYATGDWSITISQVVQPEDEEGENEVIRKV